MLSVKQVMYAAQQPEGLNNPVLVMQRGIVKERLANIHRQPSVLGLNNLRDYYTRLLSFPVTLIHVDAILKLSPEARIHLAMYEDLGDTESRECMQDAISEFTLGCAWPLYLDGVDADQFMALLIAQFKLIEF